MACHDKDHPCLYHIKLNHNNKNRTLVYVMIFAKKARKLFYVVFLSTLAKGTKRCILKNKRHITPLNCIGNVICILEHFLTYLFVWVKLHNLVYLAPK